MEPACNIREMDVLHETFIISLHGVNDGWKETLAIPYDGVERESLKAVRELSGS